MKCRIKAAMKFADKVENMILIIVSNELGTPFTVYADFECSFIKSDQSNAVVQTYGANSAA